MRGLFGIGFKEKLKIKNENLFYINIKAYNVL